MDSYLWRRAWLASKSSAQDAVRPRAERGHVPLVPLSDPEDPFDCTTHDSERRKACSESFSRAIAPASADKATIEQLAMENENVQRHLEGKTVRKVIVVPGKLVNIVVSG